MEELYFIGNYFFVFYYEGIWVIMYWKVEDDVSKNVVIIIFEIVMVIWGIVEEVIECKGWFIGD